MLVIMKYLFTLPFFLVCFSSMGQESLPTNFAIGLGTNGAVVRWHFSDNLSTIARFEYSHNDQGRLEPQLNFIGRFVKHELGNVYTGLGIAFDLVGGENSGYDLRLPVGLEYFPFEGKNISFGLETGFLLYNTTNGGDRADFRSFGLFELNFYL